MDIELLGKIYDCLSALVIVNGVIILLLVGIYSKIDKIEK